MSLICFDHLAQLLSVAGKDIQEAFTGFIDVRVPLNALPLILLLKECLPAVVAVRNANGVIHGEQYGITFVADVVLVQCLDQSR